MTDVTSERFRHALAGLTLLGLFFGSSQSLGNDGLRLKAQSLFESITGVSLPPSDPRTRQMIRLLAQGQTYEAASIAAADDAAINVRARELFAAMSTREESPLAPLSDFVLTGMYFAAGRFEDGDARKMLYGDIMAIGHESTGVRAPNRENNTHYAELEQPERNLNLLESMDAVPQSIFNQSQLPANATAGLLSTRAWFAAHVSAGTNRRPIEFTFRTFLCRPLTAMRDNTVPSDRVGRDVPRDPGGDPAQFVNNCSSCHSGLDAMRGAYAQYEWEGNRRLAYGPIRKGGSFTSTGYIAKKVIHNEGAFDTGYQQTDDTWVNYFTNSQNANIGWRGATQGRGLKEFGYMIAHSRGFSECMATRLYSLQCLKRHFHPEKMLEGDTLQLQAAADRIQRLADRFESSGYKMLELMKHTGVSCLED